MTRSPNGPADAGVVKVNITLNEMRLASDRVAIILGNISVTIYETTQV